MTFREYYQQAKNQPSASNLFIKEIAALTHRTEIAVKKWIAGEYVPDMNVQEKLASHFDEELENLFPEKNRKKKGGKQ